MLYLEAKKYEYNGVYNSYMIVVLTTKKKNEKKKMYIYIYIITTFVHITMCTRISMNSISTHDNDLVTLSSLLNLEMNHIPININTY